MRSNPVRCEESASPPEHRIMRRWLAKNYAEPGCLSSGGPLLSVEDPGERCVLGDGERGETEAAAGHEARAAPRAARSADPGTPDHLGGEVERPDAKREIGVAGRPQPQEVEVLNPGSRAAGRSPNIVRGTARLSRTSVMLPPRICCREYSTTATPLSARTSCAQDSA